MWGRIFFQPYKVGQNMRNLEKQGRNSRFFLWGGCFLGAECVIVGHVQSFFFFWKLGYM